MSNSKLVIERNTPENEKRYHNRRIHIEQKLKGIPSQYEGDIRRYKEYCCSTDQAVGTEAMLDYIYLFDRLQD